MFLIIDKIKIILNLKLGSIKDNAIVDEMIEIVGKFFGMSAKAVDGELTRENLIKAISDTGEFDLGVVKLKFGKVIINQVTKLELLCSKPWFPNQYGGCGVSSR